MNDWILRGCLRLTVVGLITALTLLSFVVGYQAVYSMVIGQLEESGPRFAGAVALGLAAGLLVRYRNDLLDERY